MRSTGSVRGQTPNPRQGRGSRLSMHPGGLWPQGKAIFSESLVERQVLGDVVEVLDQATSEMSYFRTFLLGDPIKLFSFFKSFKPS